MRKFVGQFVFRAMTKIAASMPGTRGLFGSVFSLLAGAGFDYRAKAGLVYDNSVVAPALNWYWKNALYPKLVVKRLAEDGTSKIVVGHQLQEAFERGWFYDHTRLLYGTVLSWFVNGNAFWIKVHSGSGKLLGFFFVPWGQMEPVSDDASKIVTKYIHHGPNGEQTPYRPDQIVHLTWGIDPQNQMLGLSPLWAALREVCSENELAVLSAALPRNAGLTALAFVPKTSPRSDAAKLTPAQKEERHANWKAHTTGEYAGSPVWLGDAFDVVNLGFKPDELVPELLRRINIERICVNMGLDPMVLGFKSENKTYSNYEQAVEAAYEGALLPMLNVWAIQMDRQILAIDFAGTKGEFVEFDTSNVRALQEDENELAERIRADWSASLITRAEAKKMRGWTADPKRDDVYFNESGPVKPGLDEEGKKPLDKKEAKRRVSEAERLAPFLALLDQDA